jgi:hypothetical protein
MCRLLNARRILSPPEQMPLSKRLMSGHICRWLALQENAATLLIDPAAKSGANQ